MARKLLSTERVGQTSILARTIASLCRIADGGRCPQLFQNVVELALDLVQAA
jgi:hypothetical protein